MNVNLKRLLSLLLAVMLVIGLPISAMAATVDDSTGETEPTVPVETDPTELIEPREINSPTTEPTETFTEPTDVPEETTIPAVPETEATDVPMDDALTESGFESSEVKRGVVTLEDPGEYAIATFAADKYATLRNCDQMDIILSDGSRQGWHCVDEDQSYPWDYMNMVYCLEDGKQFSVGSGNSGDTDVSFDGSVTTDSTIGESCWYGLSANQRMAIALVIMYGCPSKLWDADWGLNPEGSRYAENPNIGYRFATQVLVWEFASGYRSATPPYTRSSSYWYDLSVGMCMNAEKTVDHFLYAYNSILNDLQLHNVIPSFAGHFQNSAPEIQLNGNSVTVTDTNGVLSRFTFTNSDTISYNKSGNNLTITASGAVPTAAQCATATLPDPEASLFELWYNGYTSSYQTAIKVSLSASDPVPAYFKLKASTGSLSIKKTTEDGKNLAGWKFSIYSDAACKNVLSGPHTTDSNGELAVSGITAGTVYVKELGHSNAAVDALYECTSDNPQAVTIVSGQTATVSFNNNLRTGYGKIVKYTNTGQGLAGWKFNLYTDEACTKKVSGSPFTTGNDGIITVELKPGNYWCREVDESSTYPDWNFDTSVKKLVIKANETATITFTNNHYGYVKIVKETNTGSNLSGWKFNIYTDASCTQLVSGSPFTSGADGTLATQLLPATYFVVEVDESEKYPDWVFDSAIHVVTVEAGQTASVTIRNTQLGRGKLIKSMPDGGSVAGWVFDVYRKSDGAHMGTFTSGTDGSILTDYLYAGDYEAYEQIPDDSLYYCESPNPQTVTITAGKTANVTFENRLKPAKIIIHKVNSLGVPLPDAEFLLEWSEDGTNWTPVVYSESAYVTKGGCSSVGLSDGKLVSGKDGVVSFTGLHPVLQYRLVETKAPAGFNLLPSTIFEGEIPAEDGLTVERDVVNDQIYELPMTGSKSFIGMAVSLCIYIAGCVGALVYLRRKDY